MSNMTGKKQYGFHRLFYNEKRLNLCNYVANHYVLHHVLYIAILVYMFIMISTHIYPCAVIITNE